MHIYIYIYIYLLIFVKLLFILNDYIQVIFAYSVYLQMTHYMHDSSSDD